MLSLYSFIHNSNTAAVVAAVIQITVLILVSIFLFRWYRSIAIKQNSSFVHFNKLDVQEYVAISYVIPVLLQGFVFFFWNIFTNDLTWKTHSETTLIVHWATNFFLFLAIISKISISYLLYTELNNGPRLVVPGRILQILAVANTNLLRLKQIFVRYVSHEIRFRICYEYENKSNLCSWHRSGLP